MQTATEGSFSKRQIAIRVPNLVEIRREVSGSRPINMPRFVGEHATPVECVSDIPPE